MASAQSLLGLVNQLQTMESSFCDVLMEAALKLASLTDANVFVLVETAEGRRFAGKRHLCDSYTNGALCPVGSDIEMEVDPSVKGLRQRSGAAGIPTSRYQPTSGPSAPPRFDPTNGSMPLVSPFAHPEMFPGSPFIRKRSHLNPGSSNSSPRKMPKILNPESHTPEEGGPSVKEENDIYLDDDDAGRDTIEDDVEAFDDMPPKGLPLSEQEPGGGGGTSMASSNYDYSIVPFGSDSLPEGYDFSIGSSADWLKSVFSHPKCATLSSLLVCSSNFVPLADKDSALHKLFASFLYDVGLMIATRFQRLGGTSGHEARAFFSLAFEEFWDKTDFCKALESGGVNLMRGSRTTFAKAFARERVYNGFKKNNAKSGIDISFTSENSQSISSGSQSISSGLDNKLPSV